MTEPGPQICDRHQRLVISALRDPATMLGLGSGDLDLTLRLLRPVRLLGRVAHHLRAAGLLDQFHRIAADQLLSALVRAEARQRVAMWELDRLVRALDGLPDVPIVVAKGCAYVLAGTTNAAGRAFSDVDLLVPGARLGDVERCLKERGWRGKELTDYDEKYYRQWAHELPPLVHEEREVEVDLHHNILMRTARLKPSPALLFGAARPVPGSRVKVLAPVDMVLHAIVHLFYGGEMNDALRELVDIDDMLRHFCATELGFWEQFWSRVAMLHLERPVYYALRYTRRVLSTPVPEFVLAASRVGAPNGPVLALMDYLVQEALLPRHPDTVQHRTSAARGALYLRSHWVKMPPAMLMLHVARKVSARRSVQSSCH